jgi:hypothetical protein
LPAVNRLVAGSNPARGANDFNGLSQSGFQITLLGPRQEPLSRKFARDSLRRSHAFGLSEHAARARGPRYWHRGPMLATTLRRNRVYCRVVIPREASRRPENNNWPDFGPVSIKYSSIAFVFGW